jgi:hypothetical protein
LSRILILFVALFSLAAIACGDTQAVEELSEGQHQNLDDYRYEIKMIDNGIHFWSIYTDTEPQWLVVSDHPVLRIENFRRGKLRVHGRDQMKPEFGASMDLLTDKDQSLEIFKRY